MDGEDEKLIQEKLIARESVRLTEEQIKPSSAEERFNAYVKAVYSEFFGTFLFLLPILGACANAYQYDWDPTLTLIALAFISGFQVIAIIFCFSSLSGAQLNPAITISLWITKKISNRKCISFIIAQLLASILVMGCIAGSFPGANIDTYAATAVVAPKNATTGNIFFTEFLVSFMLTFVCFAIAFEEAESSKASTMSLKAVEETDTVIMYSTTPQSKSGFAPFAIGFTLTAIVFFGGGSGVGLNPARMFGPALFANKWDDFHIYIFGQILGSIAAGVMVVYGPQSSKRHQPSLIHDLNVVPKEVAKTLSYIGNKIKDTATGHHSTDR